MLASCLKMRKSPAPQLTQQRTSDPYSAVPTFASTRVRNVWNQSACDLAQSAPSDLTRTREGGARAPAVSIKRFKHAWRAVRVLVCKAQVVIGAQIQAPLRLASQRQGPAGKRVLDSNSSSKDWRIAIASRQIARPQLDL